MVFEYRSAYLNANILSTPQFCNCCDTSVQFVTDADETKAMFNVYNCNSTGGCDLLCNLLKWC